MNFQEIPQPLLQKLGRAWKPPKKWKVSEWSDAHRRLSSEASAEPGQWRSNRAEYQRGIMDAVNDPRTERIVVMSAAQVGKSSVIENILGFFVHQDPCPALLIQPTLEMAQTFAKLRLRPMLRDTPVLAELIDEPKQRGETESTLLQLHFTGGSLSITGANSPSSLSSRSCRLVLADELDRMPLSAGDEGDPVSLAIKRSSTFHNRKIVMVSTPTIQGISRIEQAYRESDQRRYWVPCPHCKTFQVLEWKQVQWVEKKPETARIVCESCEQPWTEAQRRNAVLRGEWRAQEPFHGTAGFHLNALVSPWIRLPELAREFIGSKDRPERLQTFVNLVLGESWEESRESSTIGLDLYERREKLRPVPEDVLLLTAGTDVQDDRLETTVCGWGRDERLWVLEHNIIWDDPSSGRCWDRLAAYYRTEFESADGRQLRIKRACVDSGGHHTSAVYAFAGRTRGVLALKGVFGSEAEPLVKASRKYKGSPLILAVSNKAKALLFYRFRITDEEAPGFIRFDESLDLDWFEQLGAERMSRSYQRGQLTHIFKPVPGRRNEAIDCLAYNVAALAVLNIRNWNQLEKAQVAARQKQIPKTETESPYQNQINRLLPKRRRRNWVTGVLPARDGWYNRW